MAASQYVAAASLRRSAAFILQRQCAPACGRIKPFCATGSNTLLLGRTFASPSAHFYKSKYPIRPPSPPRNDGDNDDFPPHPQPFVEKHSIEPTTWDPDMKDPLYRPKWKDRSVKVISAEDFANRPAVGFSDEFDNFQEGMITMSWLTQRDQKQIYQMYLDCMQHMYEKTENNRTSHEYVMRLVAQKFNITPLRAAAIVELQHNEEQILKNNPELEQYMLTEEADLVDKEITAEIQEMYAVQGLKPPGQFIEDPVGVWSHKETKQYQEIDDVLDVDALMKGAIIREDGRARVMIDTHIYQEDVDDEEIPIPLSKDCKQMMKRHAELKAKSQEVVFKPTESSGSVPRSVPKKKEKKAENVRKKKSTSPKGPVNIPWRETNGEGLKRPRWEFIAQVVNVRTLKKRNQHAKDEGRPLKHNYTSYRNNSPYNTIVECDGKIRGATMADLRKVEWHPLVNTQEHVFKGVKKGWLDKVKRGNDSAWGKAPPPKERERLLMQKQKAKDEAEALEAAAAAKEAGGDENDETPKGNVESEQEGAKTEETGSGTESATKKP